MESIFQAKGVLSRLERTKKTTTNGSTKVATWLILLDILAKIGAYGGHTNPTYP
ncbi:MAG: hypothetical protein NTZ73_00035 [Candidatus Diapherotrites archaeon]|nr:hypothetical protein [Candidatus Diapherotrites archaeon]